MEPVGRESAYNPCYLDRSTTGSLLSFCDSLSYTVYQYEHNYGVSPVRRAPKVEYHLPNDAGERPLYRWGQTQQFWQAGFLMPANLRTIAARIEKETGEKVNHAIIIGYFDGTNQFAPPHKDKAAGVSVRAGVPTDMARDDSFFVLSLGYPREFTLQKTWDKPPAAADVVWAKPLASGSMLKVSAVDNRTYCHAVHPQPGAGVRFSIIFRTIATHVPIDAAAAAIANGEAHRFFRPTPKRPLSGPLDPFVIKKPRTETLTEEQMANIGAKKQRALAIRAAKEEEARNTLPFSIVGRLSKYAHVPLTVSVPINVTPDELDQYDKNAHRVWAYLNEAWVHVGFVDRPSAAILAKFGIKRHSARLVGNACATAVVQAKA